MIGVRPFLWLPLRGKRTFGGCARHMFIKRRGERVGIRSYSPTRTLLLLVAKVGGITMRCSLIFLVLKSPETIADE